MKLRKVVKNQAKQQKKEKKLGKLRENGTTCIIKLALKESKLVAITTSGGNLLHGVIPATVQKPARAAFVAVGLTKVRDRLSSIDRVV